MRFPPGATINTIPGIEVLRKGAELGHPTAQALLGDQRLAKKWTAEHDKE